MIGVQEYMLVYPYCQHCVWVEIKLSGNPVILFWAFSNKELLISAQCLITKSGIHTGTFKRRKSALTQFSNQNCQVFQSFRLVFQSFRQVFQSFCQVFQSFCQVFQSFCQVFQSLCQAFQSLCQAFQILCQRLWKVDQPIWKPWWNNLNNLMHTLKNLTKPLIKNLTNCFEKVDRKT